MNPKLFLLEVKTVMDVEAIFHDFNKHKDSGRGRQMTDKQAIKCIAPFYFIDFRPSLLQDLLPVSSKTGKKPSPGTLRNAMNKEIIPVFKRILGLPHFTDPKDIYCKGRSYYFHGPLQAISADALRFRERPNNGNFSLLKIRAPQFIKSIKSSVAQHQEAKELLTSVQQSQFEALKRRADKLVEEGDCLFNARGNYASAYSSAIGLYHEALMINPFEHNLSDDESLWLRVARCYIQLGFYRYAIIICDYAIFNIFERNARKARAFYYLGYTLDELTLQSQDFSEKNLESVIYCCDRATYFNSNKLLPRWLKVEAFVRDFELNGGDQNRADRALADYIAALKEPMSQNSFKKYRAKLLQDAYDALSKPQWKQQFDEIRAVLEHY